MKKMTICLLAFALVIVGLPISHVYALAPASHRDEAARAMDFIKELDKLLEESPLTLKVLLESFLRTPDHRTLFPIVLDHLFHADEKSRNAMMAIDLILDEKGSESNFLRQTVTVCRETYAKESREDVVSSALGLVSPGLIERVSSENLQLETNHLKMLKKIMAGLRHKDPIQKSANAQMIKAFTDAGLLSKQDVLAKEIVEELMTGLSDPDSGVRADAAGAVDSCIKANLVSRKNAMATKLLDRLVAGLGHSSSWERVQYAEAINSLIKMGVPVNAKAKRRVPLHTFLAGLRDGSMDDANAIKALMDVGLIAKVDVEGRIPLNILLANLSHPIANTRVRSAEIIGALVKVGLIEKSDVKGRIPLEKLRSGLSDSKVSELMANANTIKVLVISGLIDAGDVQAKIPLESLLAGLSSPIFWMRERSALAIQSFVEAGLLAKESLRGKIPWDGLIAGLSMRSNGLQDSLKVEVNIHVIRALIETDLMSPKEVKEKGLLAKFVSGLSDSDMHLCVKNSEAIKTLLKTGLASKAEVRGFEPEELEWLHENLSHARLDDGQRAHILKTSSVMKGRVSKEDVAFLGRLINTAKDNSPHLDEMLETMCYFSMHGSILAQNFLEGKIGSILQRNVVGDVEYVFVGKKDRLILEFGLKSFRPNSLMPFVHRRDFSPELRSYILRGLAKRGTVDAAYDHIPQDKDGQAAYFEIISQVYDKLGIIAPMLLTERIFNGQATVETITTKAPLLKELESLGDYHRLVHGLANDTDLMLAYYCLRQSPFVYPGMQGVNTPSCERFMKIIRGASMKLKGYENPSVVMQTLQDAFRKAGLSHAQAQEITRSLLEGHVPLPKKSGFLVEDGSFIPQKIEVLDAMALRPKTLRVQHDFEELRDRLVLMLKINQLLQGLPRYIEKRFRDKPSEKKSLSLEYQRILSEIRQDNASLPRCLDDLIVLNNRIFPQQKIPIDQILDNAVAHTVEGIAIKNSVYRKLFSVNAKARLEPRRFSMADLSLANLARNIEKVIAYLKRQRQRDRLTPMEKEILGRKKITPAAALRVFFYDLASRGRIEKDSPWMGNLDKTIGGLSKCFVHYLAAVKRLPSVRSGIPPIVYLDYIDKNNLLEILRFSDGAHSCSSSDSKIAILFGVDAFGVGSSIYDSQMDRLLADATTFFFQVSTQPRGGKQIGWLKCWFGIRKDGLPFVGSNYIYLTPAYHNDALKKAILGKVEDVLFSTRISSLCQIRIAQEQENILPANVLLPPSDYRYVILRHFVRLQSLGDGAPIYSDAKFAGNTPVTAGFYVKKNTNANSASAVSKVEAKSLDEYIDSGILASAA